MAAEASEIWLDTAAVSRPPSTSVRQLAHPLEARVAPDALVGGDALERRDLAVEAPFVLGLRGPAMTLERERLHVVAGHVPLLGDHLRGAELRHLLGAVAGLPSLRTGEGVLEPERLGGDHRRADRDHAHVLHAARDDEVGRAAHHGLRREVHGLLARAALAVDRRARYLVGEPGREPAGAGDVAGLRTDRVDATEDHVVDRRGIDPGALDELADRVGTEIGRMHAGQTAALAADGCAYRVDDECLGHLIAPVLSRLTGSRVRRGRGARPRRPTWPRGPRSAS